MASLLRWVIALRPEANPIIERFSMKLIKGLKSPFPIYVDETGRNELIISGIGKANAAAATAFLAGVSPLDGRVAGWINFGIAGGGADSYGSTALAAKVTDAGNGRSWYPAATWPRKLDLPRVSVLSLDLPSDAYPMEENVRFDMEASAFYSTVLKFASVETAHVLKVVSDDPEHPMKEISKEKVETLISNGLDSSEKWLWAFTAVLKNEAERLSDPEDFRLILDTFHFSETRQHQLRRLLQQRKARGITSFCDTVVLRAQCRNAAECLAFLELDLGWER